MGVQVMSETVGLLVRILRAQKDSAELPWAIPEDVRAEMFADEPPKWAISRGGASHRCAKCHAWKEHAYGDFFVCQNCDGITTV
jgi:hypothetical protein